MFEKISPKEIEGNVFSRIGRQWMLVTAGKEGSLNTMTASWGGLGVLWGKDVAVCYIRPQRYTRAFVEREDFFTLAFFPESCRRALDLCGSKSGREVDKVKECGFTVQMSEAGAPYFDQAELVLVCRKLYAQDMKEDCFTDKRILEAHYPGKDLHRMYVGEIVEVLKRT